MTAVMAKTNDKPLMQSLGEFFGHIVKGIKTKPEGPGADETVDRKNVKVEEEDRGNMILRRTTIEEIEYRQPPDTEPPAQPRTPPHTGPDSSSSGDADKPCP